LKKILSKKRKPHNKAKKTSKKNSLKGSKTLDQVNKSTGQGNQNQMQNIRK
jgi:hypothetical protein